MVVPAGLLPATGGAPPGVGGRAAPAPMGPGGGSKPTGGGRAVPAPAGGGDDGGGGGTVT